MRASFNNNPPALAWCTIGVPSIMAEVFYPNRQAGWLAGLVLSSLRGGKKVNHHNNRSEVG